MNAGTRAYVRFTVKYTNITHNQLAQESKVSPGRLSVVF